MYYSTLCMLFPHAKLKIMPYIDYCCFKGTLKQDKMAMLVFLNKNINKNAIINKLINIKY